jgi:hypothetical protein
MKTNQRISALAGRELLAAGLLLALLCTVAGCGSSALATGSSEGSRLNPQPPPLASCSDGANSHMSYQPQDVAPKELPILVGPIVVGCGSRLGEPIRFIAYVQATRNGDEQLCYVLEQPRQEAVTGGGCFLTAPSMSRCSEDCPLSVEATVARWGDQASKGSLVTGAASGVIEEVELSTSPLGSKREAAPFIVVLEGDIQKELRLPSVVSVFASVVIPCLPAGQMVYASGSSSGKGFAMRGSDPFGCQA